MPAVSASTAPNDLLCTFSVFGRGIEPKKIALDGAKAGQPDGIRLEDAFPILRAESSFGIIGGQVEISSGHTRINLLSSQVAIEVAAPNYSVIYNAEKFSLPEQGESDEKTLEQPLFSSKKETPSFIALLDGIFSTSLIMVNSTSAEYRPDIWRMLENNKKPIQLGTLLPHTVLEVSLDELIFKDSKTHVAGLQSIKAEGVHFSENIPPGIAIYVLYREVGTRRPMTVVSI